MNLAEVWSNVMGFLWEKLPWFIKGGGRKALSLSAILGGLTVWKVMLGFQTLQALFDALTNLGIYEVPAVYYGYISLGFVLVFLYLWITRGGER